MTNEQYLTCDCRPECDNCRNFRKTAEHANAFFDIKASRHRREAALCVLLKKAPLLRKDKS